MKLFHLFLIALMLQPCPVCWLHGIVAIGNYGDVVSENDASVLTCCSKCLHSRPAQEQHAPRQHDHQNDCPCVCHVKEMVLAQTVPPLNLRGVSAQLSVVVDAHCHSLQPVVGEHDEVHSAFVLIAVPLRI